MTPRKIRSRIGFFVKNESLIGHCYQGLLFRFLVEFKLDTKSESDMSRLCADIWNIIMQNLYWSDIYALECTNRMLQKIALKHFAPMDALLYGTTLETLLELFRSTRWRSFTFMTKSDKKVWFLDEHYNEGQTQFELNDNARLLYNYPAMVERLKQFGPEERFIIAFKTVHCIDNSTSGLYYRVRYLKKIVNWNDTEDMWRHMMLNKYATDIMLYYRAWDLKNWLKCTLLHRP